MQMPEQCLENYVSYALSKYHPWFQSWGYERLDIHEYDDGEWAIVEWETMPIVPSLCRWKVILQGLRHIEITPDFVLKQVKAMDLRRHEIWEREAAKSRAVELEQASLARHKQDVASRAAKAIMGNDALVQRIAQNGMQEAVDIRRLSRHVPNYLL